MRGRDGQMIDPGAPAIVAAKDRADDPAVLFRDTTKTWIAEKVSTDVFFGVALGYFYSFHFIPKRRGSIVIVDGKLPGDDRRHTIQKLMMTFAAWRFTSTRRAWRDSNPQPADPKSAALSS